MKHKKTEETWTEEDYQLFKFPKILTNFLTYIVIPFLILSMSARVLIEILKEENNCKSKYISVEKIKTLNAKIIDITNNETKSIFGFKFNKYRTRCIKTLEGNNEKFISIRIFQPYHSIEVGDSISIITDSIKNLYHIALFRNNIERPKVNLY